MSDPVVSGGGGAAGPGVLEYSAEGRRVWRVGTLTYSRGRLGNVFFWMLWGDFCLNLMDSGVVPNVVPLQMKKYGASGFEIGLLTGTVMEILATAMVAVISTWSDRYRSRLGRRMPFILWSTPPLAVFLGLMGFSPQIAGWVKVHVPGGMVGVSQASLTLGVMSVLMVGYKFFDNFPQSVYYYLWPDVIPAKLMGTFACLFRVVATGGEMLFNRYLLKHAIDRPGMICVAAAGMYLFSFLMLVVMVREGEYPEPEETRRVDAAAKREWLGGIVERIARYLRECYSHAFYWKIYIFNLAFICGFVPFARFLTIYATDTRHIDLGRLGNALVVRDVIKVFVFLSLGPIVDRIHPIRAGVAANVLTLLTGVGGALLVRGDWSFLFWTVAVFASVAVFQGATAALGPRILPAKQYGQFCSANAMVFHVGLMLAMPGAGLLFDHVGYRYIYAWFGGFAGVSSVAVILLYMEWKRRGGDEGYVAPVVEEEPVRGFEAVVAEKQ